MQWTGKIIGGALGAFMGPLGILLGAVVIVLTWGLTWYYMRWANTHWAQVSPPSAGGAM
jgi:uncharacterized membrane protein (DUF485 family)